MWATDYDLVYQFNGAANADASSITSNSAYGNYAGAVSNNGLRITWQMNCGNNSTGDPKGIWLGANSSNKAKMILSNGSYADANGIAAALSSDITNCAVSTTYIAAFIDSDTQLNDICKIAITSGELSASATMYLLAYYKGDSDASACWHILAKKSATSSSYDLTHTFTPIASARYALAIYRSGGQFQYKAPVISFYKEHVDDSSLETPTWDMSESSVSITDVESKEVEISTNYDGIIQVESDDENVATVEIENNVITITGVNPGTATISVTGIATATYKSVSDEIAVTVTAAPATMGTYDIDVNNSLFGTSYNGTISDVSSLSGTKKGVTITYNKGTSNNYYVNDTQARVYGGTNVEISVPTGFVLTEIHWIKSSNYSASVGNYNSSTGVWTGKAQSVIFTHNANSGASRLDLNSVRVTYAVALHIGTAQYATYYNAVSSYVMPAGLEGITVEGVSGTELTLETRYQAEAVVPAGEALVLHSTSNLEEETIFALNAGTTANEPLNDNMLKGTSTADEYTEGGVTYYRLSQHEGKVGFYWGAAEGGKFQPGANKAYLALPAGAPARFIFGQQDVPTELQNVSAEAVSRKVMIDGRLYILRDGNLFDLNGRLVK